jgi:hypothetical protein
VIGFFLFILFWNSFGTQGENGPLNLYGSVPLVWPVCALHVINIKTKTYMNLHLELGRKFRQKEKRAGAFIIAICF